ncbi:hypothetical protein M409DRAFT_61885 [Zasmidium cellare ATCC 36951]|uniref:HD domain-containing protein n=1 Tax=Zasmidium cellare ATCC 36951 TaxID=1080233 RepID=A0A6A6D799_ZASCE|nr:uncharacterized protein M409DRAFT_61885 [Zasmidium cellare ATCC 36951]KAF2173506.1 hypothetical protein M409DRAFT_61885 [Zasmidium cellare ATCC 36951]
MCPPPNPSSLTPQAPQPPTPIPSNVPTDPISQAAYNHAATNLHPTILAHSLRVYTHALHLSQRENSVPWHHPSHLPLLFTACIFHDIGTTPLHNTSPTTRFEIEGADAAVAFLSQHNIPQPEKHAVWTAIALHDTPQIAERIAPLSRLVRLGVAIDFKRPAALELVSAEWVEEVEAQFPRGEIEKVLGDVVVEQALEAPEKAPAACWPGGLLRSKLENPGWEGVNKAF